MARRTALVTEGCSIQVVYDEEMLIVEDATQDDRFKDSELVKGDQLPPNPPPLLPFPNTLSRPAPSPACPLALISTFSHLPSATEKSLVPAILSQGGNDRYAETHKQTIRQPD